jgi:streptogramin lyase
VATIPADKNYAQSTGTANLVVEVQPGVSTGITPVASAHVHLLAAATSGYGAASTSVLTSSQTGQSDAAGPYVQADANGLFTLPGGATCTAGQQMYFYASGGTINSTANSAATFMAPVGVCKAGGVIPSFSQVINEVTTVTTAYALSGFATDPLHVSDDEGVGGNTTASIAAVGLATAFATPFNLEAAGAALSTTPAGNGNVPQQGINTIADILAACNESTSSSSTPCTTLFNNMLSGGATGTAATDTATAAIYFAHNPYPGATQMTNLFGKTQFSAPYLPTLGQLPNDWSIAIYYDTTSKNSNPYSQGVPGIAIDPSGNVWLAQVNTVTELSPLGVELSTPTTGYNAGNTLSAPFGLASDVAGNIWIANCFGSNIVELSPTGTVLTPTGGFAAHGIIDSPNTVAFDGNGKLWLSNAGNPGLIQLDPATGTVLQNLTKTVAFSPSFAIDGAGDIWSPSNSSGNLLEFSNSGTLLSGATGYTTGSDYQQTFGTAIDAGNNVWVSNYNGFLFKFIGSTGAGTEYSAGGLSSGYELSVDGGNHIWVASRQGDIVEYDDSGNALSPTTTSGNNGAVGGFQGMAGNIDSPISASPDQAGNVWAYSLDNGTVTEVIGIGSPSVVPLAAANKYNKIGQRP